MRKIEFRGYVGDEELFVAVPLNEKKAKLSKKDILKIVGALKLLLTKKELREKLKCLAFLLKNLKKKLRKGIS